MKRFVASLVLLSGVEEFLLKLLVLSSLDPLQFLV